MLPALKSLIWNCWAMYKVAVSLICVSDNPQILANQVYFWAYEQSESTSPVSTHILHQGWLQCLWKVVTTFSISQNSGIYLHSTCVCSGCQIETIWLVAELLAVVLLKVGPTEESWPHNLHVKNKKKMALCCFQQPWAFVVCIHQQCS